MYLYIYTYHIFKGNLILFIFYVALVGIYVALSYLYLNDTDGIHICILIYYIYNIYDILCTLKYIILTFSNYNGNVKCNSVAVAIDV